MQYSFPLHRNQVLMDASFIQPFQIRKLCGKRRFTLAHECAHQILFQMETDKIREACRRKYSARAAYSLRELKTREDWNEWQANVLGAAILMPQREIDLAVAYYARGRKLISYDAPMPIGTRLPLIRIWPAVWCFQDRRSHPAETARPLGNTAMQRVQRSFGGVGMKKNIRVSEPSPEMQEKIRRRDAPLSTRRCVW